jgi:hypothetical protein
LNIDCDVGRDYCVEPEPAHVVQVRAAVCVLKRRFLRHDLGVCASDRITPELAERVPKRCEEPEAENLGRRRQQFGPGNLILSGPKATLDKSVHTERSQMLDLYKFTYNYCPTKKFATTIIKQNACPVVK